MAASYSGSNQHGAVPLHSQFVSALRSDDISSALAMTVGASRASDSVGCHVDVRKWFEKKKESGHQKRIHTGVISPRCNVKKLSVKGSYCSLF